MRSGSAKSKRRLVASVIWLFANYIPITSFPQSALSDDIRADILRAEIIKTAKGNGKGHLDYAAILKGIDAYKKLDVEIPPPLFLVEAKAAHATFDSIRAIEALESFMMVADRKSPEYQQAVQLYPEYQTASQPSRQLLRDKIIAQPLECKDSGNMAQLKAPPASEGGWFQSGGTTVNINPSVAETRAQLTVTWNVGMYSNYINGTLDAASTAVRITLVPSIPYTPEQALSLATISLPEDAKFPKGGNTIPIDMSKTIRNPPAGKYCVIVEGLDTEPSPSVPFVHYVILKGPLVVLP